MNLFRKVFHCIYLFLEFYCTILGNKFNQMSQANNRGVVNKRLRISPTGAFRQHENQSSASSTNVAQSQYNSPGLSIDNETELSSDLIKEQLDSVSDIVTQPIIEVPTKRLLHLKELGGNLFVSSSTKIYSKTLQKINRSSFVYQIIKQ